VKDEFRRRDFGAMVVSDIEDPHFDGCAFGKYCYISLGPTSLVSFIMSPNLFARWFKACSKESGVTL
jgi:hypothetical protein